MYLHFLWERVHPIFPESAPKEDGKIDVQGLDIAADVNPLEIHRVHQHRHVARKLIDSPDEGLAIRVEAGEDRLGKG